MAIRTYKVTLDSKNAIAPEPVFLRQGDKTGAVVIDATLMDNGTPVSLSGLTPMFKANTADGQAVIADSTGFNIVNASGGEFTYRVPSQLGSVDGKIKIAYFSLSDSSGTQSTFNVVFIVKKAADMTQESAKDWVSSLSKIIEQYNQWVNNAHSSWQDFVNENKEIIESIDPGGTLLAKVNQLSSEISDTGDITISVDGGVQAPFTSALVEFKHTINLNNSVLKIGLLQDIHFSRAIYNGEYGEATDRGLVHIQHMGVLADSLDLAVYNGDNVHGREAKSSTVHRIKQLINTHRLAFGQLPTIWTIGNHDDNNVYFSGTNKAENTLTLKEMEDAFEIDQTYDYKDFPAQKVRVIVLDAFENPEIYNDDGSEKYNRSYNSVFSQNQLTWLSQALQAPDGYSVIIFMHCPPLGFASNKPYNNYQDVNHDLMLGMVKAYITGTSYTASGTNTDYPAVVSVDFTARGVGAFVGIVAGHEHHDLDPQTIDGIRVIERTCNLPAGAGRSIGDISEDAFDVIEIDGANKHCKFHRFGAGNSLEFDY